ncbi:MAG: hypothetical protein SF182_28030 [Deltaproteobacteria bacterium]|nr:hypothetical protein [Deltaproteobacteria bacterium]
MTAVTYDDNMSMRAARQRYFDANGFDSSYSEKWVKLKAGPIALYFPNAAGRVRAVKFHDLHHIITGYQTDWAGEVEIAAYEIGAGCGPFAWAWLLNLQALSLAPTIAPRRALRAFVRGRHARSLYYQGEFQDALLDQSVGDVRRTLTLDRPTPAASAGDVAAYVGWVTASVVMGLAPLAGLAWLVFG